jgi:RNA polymerase sigma factor (sigma-70 family)
MIFVMKKEISKIKRKKNDSFEEKDQNTELVSEWKKNKDNKTLEQIITNHYSIIHSIINHYNKAGLSKEDLLAEGILGILTALNKFDAHKNVKFTTYAYFWIKAKVLKFVKNSNPFGKEIFESTKNKQTEESQEKSKNHANFDDLDEVLDHAIELQSHTNKFVNLDDELQDIYWTSFVNSKLQLEEIVVQEDFSEILKIALLSLTKKEQYILEKRWLCEKKLTFEKIAIDIGLSAERIRQIEKEIFTKIRESLIEKCGSLRGEILFSVFIQFLSSNLTFFNKKYSLKT